MIDRNKNIERMENLNNEIILERKRKKLIEKNREIKSEKMNMIQALNSLYKEIMNLNVDCEFLENFDRLMDTEEKIKRMFEEDSSKFNNNKKKKIQFKNLSERDALLSEMRVFISLYRRLLGKEMKNLNRRRKKLKISSKFIQI